MLISVSGEKLTENGGWADEYFCSSRKMALTRKEIDARRIQKCKEENICPSCGKPKDRDRYYCSKCREKNNERKRKDKEFCRENHICTTCQKERVYGDEKTCLSCREKASLTRKAYTEEQKMKYKKISMESARKTRERLLENGKCPVCKKRKLEEGKKKCRLCLDKDAERQRLKRINQQNIREYRKKNKLCYFCGGIIEDKSKNVCNACSDNMVKSSAKASKNKYWKQQNNLIFKNG